MNVTNSLLQRRTALLEKARQILDNNTTLTVEQKTEIMGLRKAASELKAIDQEQSASTINVDPADLLEITGGEGSYGFLRNCPDRNQAKAPTVWRDSSGRAVRVLDPRHRMADLVQPNYEHRDLRLGALVKGWLTGKWDGATAERRALGENINTAGGMLVPDALSARLIDAARDKAVLFRLGARTLPMSTDHVTIARCAADPEFSMVQESVAIPEGDPSFDGVTLTAKKIGTIIRASRELIEDAANAETMIEQLLINSFAAELDRQCLWGSGSSELLGVYNYTGIGSQTSAGTPSTWAKWIAAWAAILANGGTPTGFTLAPRDAGTLESIVSSGVYLLPPPSIQAMQRAITPSTPITGLPGSNESASLMAQWDTVVVGVRRDVRLEVTDQRYYDTDELGFKLTWRGDLVLEQASWVQRITGITAAG